MTDYKFVKCMICGKEYSQLNSHITRTHKITVKEYKNRFPDAILVCKEILDKISNKNKGKQRSQEHKDNLKKSIRNSFINGRTPHNKGIIGVRKASEETKRKMREARARSTYVHSEETLKKISNGNKKPKPLTPEGRIKRKESYEKRMNTFYGPYPKFTHSKDTKRKLSDIAKNRDPKLVEEKVRLMNEARKGQIISEEERENHRKARLKYMSENDVPNFTNTLGEKQIAVWLYENNIEFIQQYLIEDGGWHLYDFYIPKYNLLIEFDGRHHWDKIWFGISGKTQEEKDELLEKQKQKDIEQTNFAIRRGFKIIRLRGYSSVGDNKSCSSFTDQMKNQKFDISSFKPIRTNFADIENIFSQIKSSN